MAQISQYPIGPNDDHLAIYIYEICTTFLVILLFLEDFIIFLTEMPSQATNSYPTWRGSAESEYGTTEKNVNFRPCETSLAHSVVICI